MLRHENVNQMLVQMLWRYARGKPYFTTVLLLTRECLEPKNLLISLRSFWCLCCRLRDEEGHIIENTQVAFSTTLGLLYKFVV